jgi:DNA polymerase-3 subunit epsilon
MDLQTTKFLILDCQTTGMQPSVGSLLELAWAVADAGEGELNIQGGLVALPEGEDIPSRVREITGIRLSDLAGARSKEEIREAFLTSLASLMESGASRPVALVHYAQFEESWLRDLLGVESLPFDVICTHRISKKLFPTVPSRNIRGLTGYFGL